MTANLLPFFIETRNNFLLKIFPLISAQSVCDKFHKKDSRLADFSKGSK